MFEIQQSPNLIAPPIRDQRPLMANLEGGPLFGGGACAPAALTPEQNCQPTAGGGHRGWDFLLDLLGHSPPRDTVEVTCLRQLHVLTSAYLRTQNSHSLTFCISHH